MPSSKDPVYITVGLTMAHKDDECQLLEREGLAVSFILSFL
jgi:hypothetical protein